MAVPAGVKLDDGTGGYAANCFPVRGFFGQADDAFGGAWLVAHRAEQRRRFKAILCTKPKTYEQLKEERKQREKAEKRRASASSQTEDDDTAGLLDGFFMMKHCCVEDPSDVCAVNVSGQDLVEAREEDFQLFDNVAYVSAAENLLPFEAFKHFPIIRELELPVNGLRNLKIELDDFPYLEVLDLSFNNLSQEDILNIGILPKIKVLHLSGNGLTSLPSEMAQPVRVKDEELSGKISRFASLEILYLDENKLTDMTTFANLAGLRKLKRLYLDKNKIYSVPHLRAVGGKMVESEPPSLATTPRHATPRTIGESGSLPSSRKSSRGASRKSSKLDLEGEDAAANVASTSLMDPTLKEIKEEDEGDGNSVTATTQIGSDLFASESPPPFPELEFLSLAYNQISEEEGLLAVAAWPMLSELVIHNNPLTLEKSGDPPLLTRYLVDRLGIHLTRLKPKEVQKPGPRVPVKKQRQVSTVVPKVPKVPVEQLMLEAPSRFALPSSQIHTPHPPSRARSAPSPSLDPTKPLPPIAPTPPPPRKTPPGVEEGEEEARDRMSRTQMWTEDNFRRTGVEEGESTQSKKDETADDPVFLTQVDNQEEEEEAKPAEKVEKKEKKTKRSQRVDSAAVSMAMPPKYKGYELLLDVEDDPTMMIPPDIHGSVKALQYALDHPIVHKDNKVDLDRLQKPFEPYERSQVDYGKQFKSKAERLEDMMHTMKERVTTQEISLAAILEDKKKYRQEYPEAEKLLSKIQAKYKTVRAASMKDSSEARETFDDTVKGIKETSDKLQKTKTERGSSRTKTT